jgi:hypothetical protein
MKRFLRQLFCLHATWHPTLNDTLWRLGLKEHACDWCGKRKHFPAEKPPMSLNEAWPRYIGEPVRRVGGRDHHG